MRGMLEQLYRALYVEGPSGPRPHISGMIGVFAYGGNERKGDLCLFKPDDPEAYDGRVKLRPSPGVASVEGDTLRFTIEDGGASYAWELLEAITDPEEEQNFLDFAIANDRIVRHLLKAAQLYG